MVTRKLVSLHNFQKDKHKISYIRIQKGGLSSLFFIVMTFKKGLLFSSLKFIYKYVYIKGKEGGFQ